MLERAINRSLALVLWGTTVDGEDDVAVFKGILSENQGRYFLQRCNTHPGPELLPEWLARITEVPEDLRATLLDCEFQLALTVGDVEDDGAGFAEFGLKWPS